MALLNVALMGAIYKWRMLACTEMRQLVQPQNLAVVALAIFFYQAFLVPAGVFAQLHLCRIALYHLFQLFNYLPRG